MMLFYVVTGNLHSGTSMMMSALMAGGLRGAYTPAPAGKRERHELDPEYLRNIEFPLNVDGELFKLVWKPCYLLAPWPDVRYKMVYMYRPQAEIIESFQREHGVSLFGEVHLYDRCLPTILARLRNRKDVDSVVRLNYHDVLENPDNEFRKLTAADWPIDIAKASSVIDARKCHFGRNAHPDNSPTPEPHEDIRRGMFVEKKEMAEDLRGRLRSGLSPCESQTPIAIDWNC